jgi:hypothetical protein
VDDRSMLTIYRRHRKECPHKSRKYPKCRCPIWAQGVLRGIQLRKPLDLVAWDIVFGSEK